MGEPIHISQGEDATRYAELAIGAEFLAAISMTAAERIEHLMMAGVYHMRARQAGGVAGPFMPH